MPTYRTITLGCKVNQYETLQVEQLLQDHGFTPTQDEETDLVLLNTCSVTSQAAAKSRNLLRRLARKEPNRTGRPAVIAMGCWTTSDTQVARKIAGEDVVFTRQMPLAERLTPLLKKFRAAQAQTSSSKTNMRLPLLSSVQPGHQRAVMKVQDGCDAHCTYCIIPKLRTHLSSKPIDDAVKEARQLVAAGHREIVLTGIFLGAYGQKTALHRRQEPKAAEGLERLVTALCTEAPGLLRLRLSSLEPGDLTPSLAQTLASHPQVVPHFHLPMQSGSDEILRRMNRQYTREDFRRAVAMLKRTFDRPALTTDLIVGFPGETDDLFEKSLSLIQEVQFLQVHAFPYSPRTGTAAARWKDQFIHSATVSRRMREIEQLSQQQNLAFRQQFVGARMKVLVERLAKGSESHSSIRHGRCERYFPIHFEIGRECTGELLEVEIQRVSPQRTHGVVV